MNVYERCPEITSDRFLLRLVAERDCGELLKVYSDPAAVPLFNSDNCNGDDFHYTAPERMEQAIRFWIWSYEHGYFVRWSIVDREENSVVGTVELCFQNTEDPDNIRGVLRIDLRSDYENQAVTADILSLMVTPCLEWFGCRTLITKAKSIARARIKALTEMGFVPMSEPLIGHDGTEYGDYYEKRK